MGVFDSQLRKGAWPRETNLRGFTLSPTCHAVASREGGSTIHFFFLLPTWLNLCYSPRFMARSNKSSSNSSANIGFEAKLWLAADKLRSNMDAAEYKHVVLGLIFLKYISDSFEEHTRS